MQIYESIQNKIISNWNQLESIIANWRKKGDKVIFTNGCFDIVHKGHVEYLSKSSSLADRFIIGLNTDASVRKIKGEGRPVNDQDARATLLAAFGFVDLVIYFDQDTPYELIKRIQPDFLVKGSDYNPEEIVGYDIVTQKGGEVRTVDLVEGYSTTNLIQKIKSAY